MQSELAGSIGNRRYFGRDLTNIDNNPNHVNGMEEEKVSYLNIEQTKLERQRQGQYRNSSVRYGTLIQNNPKGQSEQFKPQEEFRHKRQESKDKIHSLKGSLLSQAYYGKPKGDDYPEPMEMDNELPQNLGYQPTNIDQKRHLIEELNPYFNHRPLPTQQGSNAISNELKEDRMYLDSLTFGNSSFKEAYRLPLNSIWSHLISKRVHLE